jgi:hypothetical protein
VSHAETGATTISHGDNDIPQRCIIRILDITPDRITVIYCVFSGRIMNPPEIPEEHDTDGQEQ